MNKTGGIIGVSLMIGTTIFAANTAQATTATTSYTAPQKTNIRTGQGTNTALFSTVATGTKITGVLQSSGWVKISTPAADAGKYVYSGVLTTSAPSTSGSTAGQITAWAGYTTTYTYSASGSHGELHRIPVNTQVSGNYVNATWFLVKTGPYAGQYMQNTDLLFDAPGTSYGSSKPASVVPDGRTVTRYAMSNDFNSVVRSQPTTHSSMVTTLASGTALTGQYVNNGTWFKITAGAQSGHYISADRVFAQNSMSYYNGDMPKGSLCTLPPSFNDAWAPDTNRALECNAAASFQEMNAAFKAKFGYNLTVDEGYRDLKTQDAYESFLGYPRAAVPGKSNHGLGSAVDLEGYTSAVIAGHASRYNYGSAADQWLTANGMKYGWDRPAYMDANGSNPEYWHYNYVG